MKPFCEMKPLKTMTGIIKRSAAAALAAVLLSGCAGQTAEEPPALIAPVNASTETDVVTRGDIAQEEFYFAAVKARMEDLFFDRALDGYGVQYFEHVEGDEVKEGDVILRLNVDGLEEELAGIEERLKEQAENARAPREIYEAELRIAELQMKLAKEDGASEDELALMQIALDKKKLTNKQNQAAAEKTRSDLLARAEVLRDLIAKSVLYAPRDGILAKVFVSWAEGVSHRNPVAVIADPEQLYIELSADTNVYDSAENQYTAHIGDTDIPLVIEQTEQVNTATGAKRPPLRFVPQDAIPPEMVLGAFAYVRITKAAAYDTLYVPRNAVFSTASDTHVYRMVDNGTGTLVQEPVVVQTGVTNETYVEIKQGLSEGDVVFVKQ